MSDKIEPEVDNRNTSENDQPEKADGKNNISNQQNILTRNEEQIIMEVFHQAHHKGKKPKLTYFWEFLMLFLAVFCGFLAEYLLEHQIENEKGKQYVESMIADIIADSVKINRSLLYCLEQESGLDSLSKLVLNQPYNDSIVKKIYILHLRHSRSAYTVPFTQRTISQLKNSGGMRLLPNRKVSDIITVYNETTEDAEYQGDYFAMNSLGDLNNYNIKLFNMKHFINSDENDMTNFLKPTTIVKFINDDEKFLYEYGNTVRASREVLTFYIKKLKGIQQSIPETLEILNKEID